MITIDIDSSEAIFNQLIRQVKNAIENKYLQPNDQLPSIRQLAGDLDINSKTVAKAYRLLERDSVIVSKGYRGTFVHEDALLHCQFNLDEWLESQLSGLLTTFKHAGATDSEIRIAFNNVINQQSKGNSND